MAFWGGRKQHDLPEAENSESAKPTPSPSSSRRPVGFETVLGASTTLNGDLRSQGNVRLDGTFEGTLEIDGNVLVGETAKITADIHAKNVSVAGAVRGDVSGKKVEILRTGRVWGDITATAISTEEGCFIDGKITMVTHEAARSFDHADVPLPDTPDKSAASAPEPDAEEESAPEPDAPDTSAADEEKDAN